MKLPKQKVRCAVLLIGATWLILALAFPLYSPFTSRGGGGLRRWCTGLSRSLSGGTSTVVVPDNRLEEKKEEVKEPRPRGKSPGGAAYRAG